MQNFKKFFKFFVLYSFLLISIFALWVSSNYTIPIIMYHNVDYSIKPESNWVNPERFEMHMKFLYENDYDVISFDDYITAKTSGRALSRRTVVITFDDGYDNNYKYALPILTKYQMPAIVFMPSGRIGKKGHLTLEQLKEMINAGIEIGSHTRDHIYLPDKPLNVQEEEIKLSKKELEEALDIRVKYLAYPIGGFSDGIKRMVQESGYKAALTTNRGSDRYNNDLYELNRVRFSDKDDSEMILRAKLSGYYNLFRRLRKPH